MKRSIKLSRSSYADFGLSIRKRLRRHLCLFPIEVVTDTIDEIETLYPDEPTLILGNEQLRLSNASSGLGAW